MYFVFLDFVFTYVFFHYSQEIFFENVSKMMYFVSCGMDLKP